MTFIAFWAGRGPHGEEPCGPQFQAPGFTAYLRPRG